MGFSHPHMSAYPVPESDADAAEALDGLDNRPAEGGNHGWGLNTKETHAKHRFKRMCVSSVHVNARTPCQRKEAHFSCSGSRTSLYELSFVYGRLLPRACLQSSLICKARINLKRRVSYSTEHMLHVSLTSGPDSVVRREIFGVEIIK